MEVVFHTKGTKNRLEEKKSCPKRVAKHNDRDAFSSPPIDFLYRLYVNLLRDSLLWVSHVTYPSCLMQKDGTQVLMAIAYKEGVPPSGRGFLRFATNPIGTLERFCTPVTLGIFYPCSILGPW